VRLAARAGPLLEKWLAPGVARSAALAGLAALALVPALWALPLADDPQVRFDRRWDVALRLAGWVKRHTTLDAVFAGPPEPCYFLSGLTGRKCVALPPGHMNPAVDPRPRLADLERLLKPEDEAGFLALAWRYRVSHVLLLPPDPARARETIAACSAWPSLSAAYVNAESSFVVLRVAGADGSAAAAP
jgi:hypothetical protein